MKNIIILNIKGKNVYNFIQKLHKNNIDLLKILYNNSKDITIHINYSDYGNVMKLKSIYEINIVNEIGLIKTKKIIKRSSIFLIMILIGLGFLIFLSNIIFKVEIVHNEAKIRELIKNELKNYGIAEKKLIKNFNEIEEIKKSIQNKYKDLIEWIEIERIGTKYIVRLQLRKIVPKEDIVSNRHIVSKKDAIVKQINAIEGEIVTSINSYVKKGSILISGDIKLYEDVKKIVSAKGSVYGEVWYQVNSEYPFIYYEKQETNKKKKNYLFNFFNKKYSLLNNYSNSTFKNIKTIQNLFLPISFSIVEEREVNIIEEVNTIDEAKDKAILKAKEKIEEQLNNNEYIINYKLLSTNIKESKIECVIFFTVYEDITDYVEIEG